jgi:hypothetical protein
MTRTLGFLLFFASLSPAAVEAQDADTQPAWGLALTGASFFTVGYATSVALAAYQEELPLGAIPVVGPWIVIGETDDGFLVMPAILQTCGFLLAALGLLTRRHRRRPRLEVAPTAFDRGGGLVATGIF